MKPKGQVSKSDHFLCRNAFLLNVIATYFIRSTYTLLEPFLWFFGNRRIKAKTFATQSLLNPDLLLHNLTFSPLDYAGMI